MGTRSLTVIKGLHVNLCVIYSQYDGYPTGHGADLLELLGKGEPFRILNGFNGRDEYGKAANGMGCLAAQVIKGLKDGLGGVYVYPPGAADQDCGQDYVYTLYLPSGETGELHLKCQAGSETLYDGPIHQFDPEAVEAQEAAQ